MPRKSRFADVVVMVSALPPGTLGPGEQELVEMLSCGLGAADIAERLGVSVATVYSRLRRLEECAVAHLLRRRWSAVPGSRPDPVRDALESDQGRVRMAADVVLRRPFRDLPYCQKQVAGVNGLTGEARRWMQRERRRVLAYQTEVGHETRMGVAVDPFFRLLAGDLLELARVRLRVREEGSAPPPRFPEGREGGAACWLGVGAARGPRSVSWLCAALRERLLGVLPSPERVGQARVAVPGAGRKRGIGSAAGEVLEVYLVPELWVGVRWAVPVPGLDLRRYGEVRVARAEPCAGVSMRAAGDESRVVGFRVGRGAEPGRRRVLLALLWLSDGAERERAVEFDLPALLLWRRGPGEPWFSLPGDILQVGDRVRRLEGEDAWVLLGGGLKVRQVPPVKVAALVGYMVGGHCLLATPGDVPLLVGDSRGMTLEGYAADCVWEHEPARRVEDRVTGRVVVVPRRLTRVWLGAGSPQG